MASVEGRLERLKNERERLGGVNLRADEEANEITDQLTTMETERDDLIEAIKKLRTGIFNLNREARARLLSLLRCGQQPLQIPCLPNCLVAARQS